MQRGGFGPGLAKSISNGIPQTLQTFLACIGLLDVITDIRWFHTRLVVSSDTNNLKYSLCSALYIAVAKCQVYDSFKTTSDILHSSFQFPY